MFLYIFYFLIFYIVDFIFSELIRALQRMRERPGRGEGDWFIIRNVPRDSENGKFGICSVACQAVVPEILWCRWSQRLPVEHSFLLGKDGLFVLLGPSTGWIRPTRNVEGNQLYLKFTNLNVYLIQNHSPCWHIKLIITFSKFFSPSTSHIHFCWLPLTSLKFLAIHNTYLPNDSVSKTNDTNAYSLLLHSLVILCVLNRETEP